MCRRPWCRPERGVVVARFRKVDPRFWIDEKIRRLVPLEKLIALYCITAQSNRIGLFQFSPAKAAEDLETSPESFAKGFKGVCERLNFGWHKESRVLYLPTWWKYNRPENPNVLKACLADLHEVPQPHLFTAFSQNLAYLPETFHETFREGCDKPSPQQSPHQEQEQKQEKEQEQENRGQVAEAPSPSAKKSERTTKRTLNHPWPEDLALTKDMRDYATNRGIDPDAELRYGSTGLRR
jgi:hypothetical protein